MLRFALIQHPKNVPPDGAGVRFPGLGPIYDIHSHRKSLDQLDDCQSVPCVAPLAKMPCSRAQTTSPRGCFEESFSSEGGAKIRTISEKLPQVSAGRVFDVERVSRKDTTGRSHAYPKHADPP